MKPASPTPDSGATSTTEPVACAAPLEGGFGKLWRTNERVQAQLGCPLRAESAGPAVEQIFETGTMYWWDANQQIYVLAGGSSGQWSVYADTWREDEELKPLSPPPGLYAPVRGFGKVWRNYPAASDALGWGVRPEAPQTGVYQRFQQGTMLYSWDLNDHGRQIYVLFADGSYATYPDAE